MTHAAPGAATTAAAAHSSVPEPLVQRLPDNKTLVLRVMPMPADANGNGDIFGGWIMAQVDLAGAVLPMRITKGRIATVAIFLPAFVLVAIFGTLLQRIRQSPRARGALDGMNAAVVGLMIVVAGRLAAAVLLDSQRHVVWLNAAVAVIATVLLARGINATWLIVTAGACGALVSVMH